MDTCKNCKFWNRNAKNPFPSPEIWGVCEIILPPHVQIAESFQRQCREGYTCALLETKFKP